MTKRKKGQKPYESEHPNVPGRPDVPGHEQRSKRVNKEQKRLLEEQIERLRKEIVTPPEKGGERLG